MITHVVLMRFKPENKAEVVAAALAKLRDMVGRVPPLRALEAGEHVGPKEERAFDLALVTRFDDLAGLEAYAVDPVHAEVKRWLGLNLAQAVVVDFPSV